MRKEETVESDYLNFIRMYCFEYFGSIVQRFSSIPLFLTNIGHLAHKAHVQESYWYSIKNHIATQILNDYSHIHALGMYILNLKAAIEKAPSSLTKVLANSKLEDILGKTYTNYHGPIVSTTYAPLRYHLNSLKEAPKIFQTFAMVLGIPDLVV
jgi:hypothetical protein